MQYSLAIIASPVIGSANVQNLQELAHWGTPDITDFEFINGNKILLAATSAGVYYFNADDLSYQHFFDTEGALTALAVSEDEEWVVTGDNKGTVAVWNIKDGKPVYKLEGMAKQIVLAGDLA